MGITTLGVLLIIAGGLLLADRWGYVDFRALASTWWPLLIVVSGLALMRDRSTRWLGALTALFGLLWQLNRLGLLPGGWAKAFWPAVLILLGVYLVLRGAAPGREAYEAGTTFTGATLFGSRSHVVRSAGFRRAQVTTLFGDTALDLRETRLDPDGAYLDLVAVFGDIDVVVPADWQVVVRTASILGEVHDRRAPKPPGPGPVLTIGGAAVFGDVEIRS
ncbi:MAG: DUF5668 domain-containing protein [Thermaerobacter sp.]